MEMVMPTSTGSAIYIDCDVCEGIFFVGIEEGVNSVFGIYPNPTNGQITVDLKRADNAIMEVYDLNGRRVLQDRIDSQTQQFDLSELPTSVYMVKVQTGDGRQIGWERLIVE